MKTAFLATDQPDTPAVWTAWAGTHDRAPVPPVLEPVWPELVTGGPGDGPASGLGPPPPPAPSPPSYTAEEVAALCAVAAAEAAATAEARLAGEVGREAEAAQARLAEGVAALATAVADRRGRLRADVVGVGAALGRLLAYEAIARDPLAAAASVVDELIAELRDEPDVVAEVAPALVDGLRAHLDAVAADSGAGGLVEVRASPGLRGGEVRVLWRDGWAERLRRDLEARAAEILGGFEEAGGLAGRVVVVENGEIAEVSA